VIRFGTDGIRGVGITELTPSLALDIGRAAARISGGRSIIIGRDPRLSGPILEHALAAGAAAEGVDVVLVGVVPTPALAWIARREDAVGIMVTASHNPWPDNGVKVFGPGAVKLDDASQSRLEAILEDPGPFRLSGADIGGIEADGDAITRYREWVLKAIAPRSLEGLSILVDAANGAMAQVAPEVFAALGAEVVAIGTGTSGLDINQGCGATDTAAAAAAVRHHGCDLGVCFDGDGDRLIALDAAGGVVDGDRLLALFARDRADRDGLAGGGVAVTVMTNLGFHQAMATAGVPVVTTPVGDRHIAEALEREGWVLGGEQSGHVIQRDLLPTGDGLLAAVVLADLVQRSQRPLQNLADEVMQVVPQVLVNVRLDTQRPIPEVVEALGSDVMAVERDLGSSGRVLVRASGTEPLIRIMVEAPDGDQAQTVADRLAQRARHLAAS
jgi:phosphoglucosamine mutase